MDKSKYFAREGSMKENTCNACETKGHLVNIFRKGGGGAGASAARGSGSGGAAKSTIPAIKPELLSFAKGTKKKTRKKVLRAW